MKKNNKLSEKTYWDSVLEKANLPRLNTNKNFNFKITMNFLDNILNQYKGKSLIEIGCGSSGWLPYFANTYNFQISGLDYSEVGCKLAIENLKMQNIHYEDIFCKDLFEFGCTNGKKFDVVFSYGVIEHFNDPKKLIQIFYNMLNPGGIIISLVPNLVGLNGILTKYSMKSIYDMHITITKDQLIKYHQLDGLLNIKTNYVGPMCLSVLPLDKSKHWLINRANIFFNIFYRIASKSIRIFYSLNPQNVSSRFFSPYVIGVYKKK